MNKRHNYCGIIFIRGGQWSWVAKIFQVWDVNSLVGVQKTLIFINIKHMLVCIYICTFVEKHARSRVRVTKERYDNFLLWTFHSIPFNFNELIVLLLTWNIWMDMYVILLPILKCFYIFFSNTSFYRTTKRKQTTSLVISTDVMSPYSVCLNMWLPVEPLSSATRTSCGKVLTFRMCAVFRLEYLTRKHP